VSGREEGREDVDERRGGVIAGLAGNRRKLVKKKVVKNFASTFGVRPSEDPIGPPGVNSE
jgi:hypothetical protein